MAETESPYRQISLEEVVTDARMRETLTALNKAWESEKARIEIEVASQLASGLLKLFGFTVVCGGIVSSVLAIMGSIPGIVTGDPTRGFNLVLDLVKTLMPYIATPLGVALGYFFRETRD